MTSEPVSPLRITLLGTGTSVGIPVIGCTCRVCTSTDPRDRRARCACWIQAGDLHLVIDTGPDFRSQVLTYGIPKLDAVLYTHHHFDHTAGLEDLRPFCFRVAEALPCYARPNIAREIRDSRRYIFCEGTYPGIPHLDLCEVTEPFPVTSRYGSYGTVQVIPIEVLHGDLPMFGYRVGRFAYLTDTSQIPERSYEQLQGVDVLVLDALRHEPHQMHFTFNEAIQAAQRIGARQTYFTHMTHTILHEEQERSLPEGIHLAYDGLTIEIDP